MISLTPLVTAKTILEQLETAVSEGNLLEVKSCLRKLDRQPMTPQEKKSTFSDLLGVSEDTLELEKTSDGFLGDKCDIARCIAGALVGVYGLSQVVHNWHTIKTGTCTYCKRIECNERCKCKSCLTARARCGCMPKKFTQVAGSSSRLMYGLSGLPYIGLALAGFYQVFQGLRGASRESKIKSAQSIQELLKERVGRQRP